MPGQEAVVGLRQRLGFKLTGHDIEHILEMVLDREPLHDGVGMRPGAVGEDELAAGELFQRRAERRVGLDGRMIDLVDIFQKIVGTHTVFDHHAAHGGAVAAIKILLLAECLVVS